MAADDRVLNKRFNYYSTYQRNGRALPPDQEPKIAGCIRQRRSFSISNFLADAYQLCAKRMQFEGRLEQFMIKHTRRSALVRRLVEAGLWTR